MLLFPGQPPQGPAPFQLVCQVLHQENIHISFFPLKSVMINRGYTKEIKHNNWKTQQLSTERCINTFELHFYTTSTAFPYPLFIVLDILYLMIISNVLSWIFNSTLSLSLFSTIVLTQWGTSNLVILSYFNCLLSLSLFTSHLTMVICYVFNSFTLLWLH